MFFAQNNISNTIQINQYGVGRLDLTKKTKITRLSTGGLATCMAIIVQGRDKISLLHSDISTTVDPIVNELEWVGLNNIQKVTFVKQMQYWIGNERAEKFNNFISKINASLREKKLPILQESIVESIFSNTCSATVDNNKVINTDFFTPTETNRETIAFLNQSLSQFKAPEFDIQYDGLKETGMPKLNDRAYFIIKDIKKISTESINERLKQAGKENLLPMWYSNESTLNDKIKCYLIYQESELKKAKEYYSKGLNNFKKEKYKEAASEFNKAILIYDFFYRNDDTELATLFYSKSSCFKQLGQYVEALDSATRAYSIRKNLYGEKHEKTIKTEERIVELVKLQVNLIPEYQFKI
ncbi:MAG: hypothetical protein LEGION0398_MBIBDBAK_01414 [Legionellaceae bacterium]